MCASCRSRQELSNEYLLAKIGVDTAENEPLGVLGENSIYYPFASIGKTQSSGRISPRRPRKKTSYTSGPSGRTLKHSARFQGRHRRSHRPTRLNSEDRLAGATKARQSTTEKSSKNKLTNSSTTRPERKSRICALAGSAHFTLC